MNSPTVHLPPKMEQGGNIRIITFTDDDVRDVENMIARELNGLTDGLGTTHLLLDFANVKCLGSAELGTLIMLHQRLETSGGRLTLFNLNAQVYEIFTVTHLQTLLSICREPGTSTSGSQCSTIKNKGGGTEKSEPGANGDTDKSVSSDQGASRG